MWRKNDKYEVQHCDGMYKDMANNICGKHVVESLPSQSMKYDFEFEN